MPITHSAIWCPTRLKDVSQDTRPYSPDEVKRLRGSLPIRHTLVGAHYRRYDPLRGRLPIPPSSVCP